MIRLEIKGRVYVKKNSRRIFTNNRTGRIVNLPSKKFEEFKEETLDYISELFGCNPIFPSPPYRVNYIFEMKGSGATDVDNMIASINDIIQEAGIIEDDKFIMSGEFKKVPKCGDYKTIIEIWHEDRAKI